MKIANAFIDRTRSIIIWIIIGCRKDVRKVSEFRKNTVSVTPWQTFPSRHTGEYQLWTTVTLGCVSVDIESYLKFTSSYLYIICIDHDVEREVRSMPVKMQKNLRQCQWGQAAVSESIFVSIIIQVKVKTLNVPFNSPPVIWNRTCSGYKSSTRWYNKQRRSTLI